MDAIAEHSCVKFSRRTTHEDYVLIINPKMSKSNEACSTDVGRQSGVNPLYLHSDYCLFNSTIFHELFHKLGMEHEHNRYDRCRYIEIVYSKLVSGELARIG